MAKKQNDDDVTASLESVAHELDVRQWKEKYRHLNERFKHLLSEFETTQARLQAILGLQETIGEVNPVRMRVRATGAGGESTAVLVASDWHVEERVDPKTVDGVNEYTPAIAERRIKTFFERGLSMIDMNRTRTRIDTLVMPVLGDLIAGAIHDDLAESNYLSPTEAILKAYGLLCGGIDFMLKEGKFKRLLVPCLVGNHGRTVKKPRIATMTKNSYEWMLYHFVAMRYAEEPRVKMQIADGYFVFVEIYSTLLRCHHGDWVKYQGGVGGVEIPLNKAIAQWNKMRRVDIDVLGHWHTLRAGRNFVLNGSTIGYNPFAISIKADFEPPQQALFLVHPKRGKTVQIPIFVE